MLKDYLYSFFVSADDAFNVLHNAQSALVKTLLGLPSECVYETNYST